MARLEESGLHGSFAGAVYGDLVGSPFMVENTYNRYFDLGEGRRAYSNGRVRSFLPASTEVSHACAAVCRWLGRYHDTPTVERLLECLNDEYSRHPRGGWTEQTRLSLSSDSHPVSRTPDWAAVARVAPVASFVRDDLRQALDLSEACVRATCSNEESVLMGRAVSHCVFLAAHGNGTDEIRSVMEREYGMDFTRSVDDIRAELRGEVREPLVIMGNEVEGAYRYTVPDEPHPLGARIVAEAAVRAVVKSDGWEDAVRTAVSYGGPSNAVAGIAGALAEALYGEVSPGVVGKLFAQVPTDVVSVMESLEKRMALPVAKDVPAYASLARDAVTIVGLGPGNTVYVVPEERGDVRRVLEATFPNVRIIPPGQMDGLVRSLAQDKEGTYAYEERPEVRTLYIQDGKSVVSPSNYVAVGMPPIQERARHLREFLGFRTWCAERQREMNRRAGNPECVQVHYADAYHMWIGARRVDFFMGDQLAGTVRLDSRGMLKVDLGEYRDLSLDARFEDHARQSWEKRSLFTVEQSVAPLLHLDSIRESVGGVLLDEMNLERLDPLEDADRELAQNRARYSASAGGPQPQHMEFQGGSQAVDKIYTIGYGRRSREGFVNTLRMLGVDTVVDVRSIPMSRMVPHFNEEVICDALKDAGIDYLSAGEKLGARFRPDSLKDASGRVDWEKVSASGGYREAIASLRSLSDEGRMVAVVCSEGSPLCCHRFGLIARTLDGSGMDVRHVLTNGEVIGHKELEGRLLERYVGKNCIPSVVSGSYSRQMAEAYRAMNDEFGYKPQARRNSVGVKRIKH